ncbi:MAG TPA: DUF362 domain-containing protein [Polyangiaceae bacterium]|jgi:uncharacterized protein (DUF362 family)|nr:MAG: hypothetical protein BWY17_03208 [Deltaproteobacteria bacterium ADurb.Bin207]HNS98109.1 DUF362 domain-containing protein [Polyangiaceae bacterium]HNZ24034.1 DUF362 domain-containing protein [Polyangiaceae bacterium]HOD21825.1 DUF362 domain-containing protein [Polyangiaceae bacterium]HOE50920.1 DUF362 domain-containing protein [Polyangiaceae bacterium]
MTQYDRHQTLTRRQLVGAAAATALVGVAARARGQTPATSADRAEKKDDPPSLAARRPDGFIPMAAPGLIVKVSKSNTLQPNQLWPTEEAAKVMLERAMTEFTGKNDLGQAFGRFVHPQDKVAIKVNGIAAQKGATMGTNKELILEIVRGVLAAGVKPENLWVFEQYPSFLAGTRIKDDVLPEGVKSYTHNNTDAGTGQIRIHAIRTRFARQLMEATAVINVALIKDHSLCGYTGTMKNMTHGVTLNPHDFHANLMDPQIPLVYAQDAIRSRVRLQITDGFKLIYNAGPLDRDPRARVPHEAVYVSTDPVAMDRIGWQIVDKWRVDRGLPTLEKAKREPTYIQRAADMGLGIADLNRIRMKEIDL